MQRALRLFATILASWFMTASMLGCGKDSAPHADPVSTAPPADAVKTNTSREPRAAADTASPPAAMDDQAKPRAAASTASAVTPAAKPLAGLTTAVATSNASVAVAPEVPAPAIAATSAAPEAPPPPPVESPKQTAQAFSVWLQSSGRYSAGQQGTVEAVVVPRAEFHCNADYPYKFVVSTGSSGVTYPKPTVRGDGLSVSTTRAVMRIPFVPQNAGEAKVGGTFHFSVCNDSQCVVEKRDVFVTVKVQ